MSIIIHKVDPGNPHDQHPRPHLAREQWRILNGQWDLGIIERDELLPGELPDTITVPFCVESELSGVNRGVRPDQRIIYRR